MVGFFVLIIRGPPRSTLFPCGTLFRSSCGSSSSRAVACCEGEGPESSAATAASLDGAIVVWGMVLSVIGPHDKRSEEHTSELQSQSNLVCRLLLEKKNHRRTTYYS